MPPIQANLPVRASDAPSPTDRAFCFACGYDLTGLELPHVCPECGRLADPEKDAAEVREWFARPFRGFTWILRPRKLPAGLWYALYDEGSARIARRREFIGMWLPAVLTAVFVGVGACLTIDYEVKIWYYDRSDPQRRPLYTVRDVETDRLFGFNLHLFRGGVFFQKPSEWVEVVERGPIGVAVARPDLGDVFPVFFALMPLIMIVLGLLPARTLVRWRASRATAGVGGHHICRAVTSCGSLLCGAIGITVWAWVVFCVGFSATQVANWEAGFLVLFYPLIFVVPGLWILTWCAACPFLLRGERAGALFPRKLRLAVIGAGLGLGGPVVAGWALIWLCS